MVQPNPVSGKISLPLSNGGLTMLHSRIFAYAVLHLVDFSLLRFRRNRINQGRGRLRGDEWPRGAIVDCR